MFVEPDVHEAKATIKADPSAPARSAIRRQRTVRYTPHVRDRPSSRAHTDAASREIHQRRLLREFMRHRGREREHWRQEAEHEAARAEAERAEASRQQRLSNGRAILRDALSYERPSQRMRMVHDYDDLPDLIPMADTERTSYSGVLQRSTDSDATRNQHQGQSRSPPPRYMPTPPYSFEESSSRSSPNGLTPPSDSANYSSSFAPANRLADETRENHTARVSQRDTHQAMLDEITRTRVEVERTREEVRRTREEAHRAWREIDSSAYDPLGELPPLRRLNRHHHSPSVGETRPPPPQNQPHVDGLGDRRRSVSPEDDNAWDTLLTTITPDERVPSVHSSFTSATASASASVAPNPANSHSYGTLATLPSSSASIAELYPNLCDNSDSEDSLTEDEAVTVYGTSGRNTNNSMNSAAPPFRRPIYSRRYDTRILDQEEQLRHVDVEIGSLRRSEARLTSLSERVPELVPELDMTYEDRYRRERLRHLRATEMGSERSSGVRPARERL